MVMSLGKVGKNGTEYGNRAFATQASVATKLIARLACKEQTVSLIDISTGVTISRILRAAW